MGLLDKITGKDKHDTVSDTHTTGHHAGEATHTTGVTDSAIHPQHNTVHGQPATTTTGQHVTGQSTTGHVGQGTGLTGNPNQPLHGQHNVKHGVEAGVAQHELNKHHGTTHVGTGAAGNYNTANTHSGINPAHDQAGYQQAVNSASHTGHAPQTGVAGVAQHEVNKHTHPHNGQHVGHGDHHLGGTTTTTTTNTNTGTNHNAHGLGGQPHTLEHNTGHAGAAGATAVAADAAAANATSHHGHHGHHGHHHGAHHHNDTTHETGLHSGQQHARGFQANAENPAAIPTAGGVKVGAGATDGAYASDNVGTGVNSGAHGVGHTGVGSHHNGHHNNTHGVASGVGHHDHTHGTTTGVGHHDHTHGATTGIGHNDHTTGINSGVGHTGTHHGHHGHHEHGSAINPANATSHHAGQGVATDAQGVPIERKVGSAYEAGYRDATSHAQTRV